VRFEDERAIVEAIEARVEQALLDAGLVRSGAPRGRSAPRQTRIEPEAGNGTEEEPGAHGDGSAKRSQDDEHEGERDAEPRNTSEESSAGTGRERHPTTAREEGASTGETATDGSIGETVENGRGAESGDEAGVEVEDGRDGRGRRRPTGREPDRAPGGSDGNSNGRGTRAHEPERQEGHGGDEKNTDPAREHDRTEPLTSGRAPAVDPDGRRDPHAHIEETGVRSSGTATSRFSAGEQRALSGERVERRREFERLPALRVLGQFDETYVVAESSDGLVLIDQHAADERVTYERLRERLPRGDAQTLAEPVEIELTAGEAALFESAVDTLAGLGFYASVAGSESEDDDTSEGNGDEEDRTGRETDGEDASDSEANEGGQRTIEVRTVPAAIAGCDPALLRDVLGAFVAAERPRETVEAAADALLADLACYPSITGNTSLSAGSIVDLLDALDSCENPYACPHGRPVVIEFGNGEIDDRFERDYPGHAGRRPE
jgi:DNA mismatch repair protein MutL